MAFASGQMAEGQNRTGGEPPDLPDLWAVIYQSWPMGLVSVEMPRKHNGTMTERLGNIPDSSHQGHFAAKNTNLSPRRPAIRPL